MQNKRLAPYSKNLSKKSHLFGVRLLDGASPDGEAEADLVQEIGKIVDDVEGSLVDRAQKVAEQVAEGIDGPSDGDDETHVGEGLLDGFGGVVSVDLGGLTGEDLEEDVEPAAHASDETGPGVDGLDLTKIAEGKHDNGADHQTPEHARAELGASGAGSSLEDKVELDHLERNGDGPIDVTVDNGRGMDGDPEFTHVEVVNASNQSDKGTNVEGGLPVLGHALGFHEEENGGCNHGDGDDPERDCGGVMGVEESVVVGNVGIGGLADVVTAVLDGANHNATVTVLAGINELNSGHD